MSRRAPSVTACMGTAKSDASRSGSSARVVARLECELAARETGDAHAAHDVRDVREEIHVVRHAQDTRAAAHERGEERVRFRLLRGIEMVRRFVDEHDARFLGDERSECDALPFAAGKTRHGALGELTVPRAARARGGLRPGLWRAFRRSGSARRTTVSSALSASLASRSCGSHRASRHAFAVERCGFVARLQKHPHVLRRMSPSALLRSVVFPAPFGPSSATNSPGATEVSRPSSSARPATCTRDVLELERRTARHGVAFQRRTTGSR